MGRYVPAESHSTACLRVTLLTGQTRAAVATIEVQGDHVIDRLSTRLSLASDRTLAENEIRYATWHGDASRSHASESIVLVPIHLNRSPERVEIHCHGGVAAAARILADLEVAGARCGEIADWFTSRTQQVLVAEAIEVLTRTSTTRAAALVMGQVRGAMTRFVSDSIVRLDREPNDFRRIAEESSEHLRFTALGRHLTRSWKVVLSGPPNVGKSSLINALLGYRRSITFNQPGTTRDLLTAETIIDGWPVELIDSAGIHEITDGEVEGEGIDKAKSAIQSADLVVWVTDRLGESFAWHRSERSALHVINKCDLVADNELPTWRADDPTPCLLTSAKTGHGVEALRLAIVGALVPVVPPADTPIPLSERQVAALNAITHARDVASTREALQCLASGEHGVAQGKTVCDLTEPCDESLVQ